MNQPGNKKSTTCRANHTAPSRGNKITCRGYVVLARVVSRGYNLPSMEDKQSLFSGSPGGCKGTLNLLKGL